MIARMVIGEGTKVEGPVTLRQALLKHPEQFVGTVTEKLLTYALGRGVEWYDKCAVDRILVRLKEDDRFATLILGIVESVPFQARRALEPPQTLRAP